jgi:hypothetical protein
MTTTRTRCRGADGVRDAGPTYEEKERRAIQGPQKGSTSFKFGKNARPTYEERERSAIRGEAKSKGSTAFNFGHNRDTEDGAEGELVASYPGDAYAVEVDDEGTIHIYELLAAEESRATQDRAPTHSQALKSLAEKYRKHVWW